MVKMTFDDVLFVIDKLRETDKYISDIYLYGGCYRFHLFLKSLLPSAEPRISKEKNHVVTFFEGKHIDIRGVVVGRFYKLTKNDLEMAEKWSFKNHRMLVIGECDSCGEQIVT
jgi:hypothetical protein